MVRRFAKTNNISKEFFGPSNIVLMDSPYCKPLVQVDRTFLYKRYKGTFLVAVAQDGRNNILPIAFAIIEDADFKSNTHRVVEFDRNTTRFRVEEMVNLREIRPARNFVVRLDERWCDCGKFQKIHLPCSHVLAACKHAHHDFNIYNSPYYKLDAIMKVYDMNNIGHNTKAHKFGLIQPQKGMQRVDQNYPELGLKWTLGNEYTHKIAHIVNPRPHKKSLSDVELSVQMNLRPLVIDYMNSVIDYQGPKGHFYRKFNVTPQLEQHYSP
ncbi:hypothetical protein V8G54_010508 [Vigna mungo]|uniref:SWIM-type domain-containing protein n=1 Tax=Vigna mungo TaxID=3915 RepID=A0AAQ3NYM7_VIGMU